MTQPLPNNWFNFGAIVLDEDGTPQPRRPYIRLLGPWTIADNEALQSTDLTPPAPGSVPDPVVAVVGVPLGTTVTGTIGSVHEVDLTNGPVEIDFPAGQPTGSWLDVKLLAGDPSVHGFTIKAPAGKNVEGLLGTARAPGDYSAQTLVFNLAGQLGQEMRFRVNGVGNVSSR